jgi:uncharacterized integral membrane protein (TIGR00698 family)
MSLESMEGISYVETSEPTPRWRRIPGGTVLHAVYPGLLVAVTIALASTWLSQKYHAPVMLFGLLIGMSFHFLHDEGRCVAGIEFASRSVLRTGVALLGARVTASQIVSLGVVPVLTVIVGVTTTITIGILVARWLNLTRIFGALSGGAVAICGASAALAIASVLPRHKDIERDTILTVVAVTTLSTLTMIFYPGLVSALHLDHVHAGVFLGGTIHDVAQVVGAGYMISPQTGDIATYVKLLRVAMLLPVVSIFGWVTFRSTPAGASRKLQIIPVFLLGFAALVVIDSIGLIPPTLANLATNVSSWCLVTGIAALGMKTSFKDLILVGWRPVGLMVVETAWIAVLVLAAVEFLL